MNGMKSLIGMECNVVFNLPVRDWPVGGYPAFVRVLDVDMPMVELISLHGNTPVWVNSSAIQTIKAMK